MLKERDVVMLTRDLPKLGLKAGDVGTIVMVHAEAKLYDVEFMTYDGDTVALEPLAAELLRPVHGAMRHARLPA